MILVCRVEKVGELKAGNAEYSASKNNPGVT